MDDEGRASLGRLLVERGVITHEQLNTALALQRAEGGMLGEILTARGWVTPLSIAAAVARQRASDDSPLEPDVDGRSPRGSNWRSLGTLLLEKQFISEAELRSGLELQRERGGFLGEILVQQGWLSAADLILALAAQFGLDFDLQRDDEDGDVAALLPARRAAVRFEVLEGAEGDARLLTSTSTFMEATDYVFDEVLRQREPGDLQIMRVDGDRREVAWSYRPGEAAAHQREDMLGLFGYHVGQWQDRHGETSDGSVAAGA